MRRKPWKQRRFFVEYSEPTNWTGYYETRVGAILATFWHVKVKSAGGSAILYDKHWGE